MFSRKACVPVIDMSLLGHVNYTDPGLSHEYFKFEARRRFRARGQAKV